MREQVRPPGVARKGEVRVAGSAPKCHPTRCVAVLLAVLAATASGPSRAWSGDGVVHIQVLSNRADLISGGDALVAIDLPNGVDPITVRVDVDGKDVTGEFAVRPDDRYEGLVTGLTNGPNVLSARLPDGSGASITITSHSIGGPVFAGPQVQPWFCTTEENGLGAASDAQCNAPTQVSFFFKNAVTGQFDPYDPANPPPSGEVATATTDQGVTAPYVVRLEKGTMDRGIYQIAVLADPNEPWSPWKPQATWNHKLMVPFGGGCAADHQQSPPTVDGRSFLDDAALSRGFAVAANGLNTLGQNCNEVVSAEAVMMLKERIAESLGAIRYTIGEGCSGGSIQQQNIAASYPGLLDGITPACSFADVWTTATEVADCGLLDRYFDQVSPHLWAAAVQRGFVEGHANVGSACLAWTALFLPAADPTGRGAFGTTVNDNGCEVPSDQRYDPETNPDGVRCGVADYDIAIFGPRPEDGFAKRPFDNVGVQYGIEALNSGEITAEQFVDLNEKIGGFDIDLRPQSDRTEADPGVIAIAYRSTRVTDARQLATVPIIDLRGQDNEEIHQSYYSYTMRARLDRANGGHGNQVIWTSAEPLVGGITLADAGFLTMDRWLSRIEVDESNEPLATKVIRNRPADAVDSCWIGDQQITDENTCRLAFPYFSNPRIATGAPLANDVLKCQLKPLDRGDYNVAFTDDQWSQLQGAFPTGVCDWRRPGVDQQPAVPWLEYTSGPGGQSLGDAPESVPFDPPG